MYKPSTYLVVTYFFLTYLPTIYETYFLQNLVTLEFALKP
jgi:hypothetical protein